MLLEVPQNNTIFYMNGKLNIITLNYFITYIHDNLITTKKITLNIDGLEEVYSMAFKGIKELARISLFKQKEFSIIGNVCKEIYDYFSKNIIIIFDF
jgi:hypothetical protein